MEAIQLGVSAVISMHCATEEVTETAVEVTGTYFKIVLSKWKTPFKRDLLVKIIQSEGLNFPP